MPYACGYCGSALEVAGEIIHQPDCSAPQSEPDEDALMPEAEALMLAPEPWMRRKLFRCRVCGATSETATYHVECQHGLSEIETWFAGDGKTES